LEGAWAPVFAPPDDTGDDLGVVAERLIGLPERQSS
jgi:hypothetical protein